MTRYEYNLLHRGVLLLNEVIIFVVLKHVLCSLSTLHGLTLTADNSSIMDAYLDGKFFHAYKNE